MRKIVPSSASVVAVAALLLVGVARAEDTPKRSIRPPSPDTEQMERLEAQRELIRGIGPAFNGDPVFLATEKALIQYDPFLRVIRIEREDGWQLLGSVVDDVHNLLNIRIRLGDNETYTLSFSQQDIETATYTLVTSADHDAKISATALISANQLRALSEENDQSVQSEVLGCGLSTAACYDGVFQSQTACYEECGTEDCVACCDELAKGDMFNCISTCGENGPDGDYINCERLH